MNLFESAKQKKLEITEAARLADLEAAAARQAKIDKLNQLTADCRRVGHELSQFPGVIVTNTNAGFTVATSSGVKGELYVNWVERRGAEEPPLTPTKWQELTYVFEVNCMCGTYSGQTIKKLREDLVDFAVKQLI